MEAILLKALETNSTWKLRSWDKDRKCQIFDFIWVIILRLPQLLVIPQVNLQMMRPLLSAYTLSTWKLKTVINPPWSLKKEGLEVYPARLVKKVPEAKMSCLSENSRISGPYLAWKWRPPNRSYTPIGLKTNRRQNLPNSGTTKIKVKRRMPCLAWLNLPSRRTRLHVNAMLRSKPSRETPSWLKLTRYWNL